MTWHLGRAKCELWSAINAYVEACGADTDKRVYGNTRRQAAVVSVENVLMAVVHAHIAADRAAVRALVDALPRCARRGCDQAATSGRVQRGGGMRIACDEHRDKSDGWHDVGHAAELRALLERMKGWE